MEYIKFDTVDFDIQQQEAAEPVIHGYGYKWGSVSADRGGGRFVQFAKGAFQHDEVFALYAHNRDNILGRTKNETLRVWQDDTGLAFELNPPQAATLFLEQVGRKDIDGMSVGVVFDVWETLKQDEGATLDNVTRATLVEISFTAHPAFDNTEITLRADDRPFIPSLDTLELKQRQSLAIVN